MVAKTNWNNGESVHASDLNALGTEVNTKGTYSKPGAGIPATDLATDAVTNAKVADDAIGINELSATGTPSSITFLCGNNTWAEVAAPGSYYTKPPTGIPASDLATDAVTNAKVADDAIGVAELSASGTASSSTFLCGNNTWATPPTGSFYTKPPAGIPAADLATDSVTNAKVADDAIGINELAATGTASGTTFLRGDNTWAVPAGGGDVTLTGTQTLTNKTMSGASNTFTNIPETAIATVLASTPRMLVFTSSWPDRPDDNRPCIFSGGTTATDAPTDTHLRTGDVWIPAS